MLELAREGDWEAVNRLSAQVARMHTQWRPDLFQEAEVSYPMELFRELIRDKAIFVAKLENRVVGYLAFHIWKTNGPCAVPRTVLSVNDIVVDEPVRSHGIGTQMMQELGVLAKAFGATDLQLTVYPQNDAAIGFYQKCGYMIKSIDMQRKV